MLWTIYCLVLILISASSTPATVIIAESNITVSYGENVSIECTLPEGQLTEVTWTVPENSTSLDRATITNTINSSILVFTADENDSGEYICLTDTNGNSSANVVVGKYIHCSSYYSVVLSPVPAIVMGPVNMTIDPTHPPHYATFSCTAFGGNGILLNFTWSSNHSSAGLNISSQIETVTTNGSTSSSIPTNTLSLEDDGSQYTCTVSYIGQTDAYNTATGSLSVGEYLSFNVSVTVFRLH